MAEKDRDGTHDMIFYYLLFCDEMKKTKKKKETQRYKSNRLYLSYSLSLLPLLLLSIYMHTHTHKHRTKNKSKSVSQERRVVLLYEKMLFTLLREKNAKRCFLSFG